MKSTFLLYELRKPANYKLYLIGEFLTRRSARFEILKYVGQNKRFVIKRAWRC